MKIFLVFSFGDLYLVFSVLGWSHQKIRGAPTQELVDQY